MVYTHTGIRLKASQLFIHLTRIITAILTHNRTLVVFKARLPNFRIKYNKLQALQLLKKGKYLRMRTDAQKSSIFVRAGDMCMTCFEHLTP